ncbi:MAG: type I DNA topoisomerase [Endomicrobium sp.]|jgi:DNA topoisomerase-1|nr:type I DNA topoisomerase [Endomicrobium sp.]
MPKYLVIVESPAKEKTISKILGKNFKVKSSYGHVRDLPKSKLGIDIENNFRPIYTNMPKAKKVISDLKKETDKADVVYLATDFDREGEAIAWHLKEALKLSDSKISRIIFHEITPEAILDSVKHPRNLDMNLVNSQQARRLLDRLVGYKLSPLLWKKIKVGLSAGRVQSVAVMLICDREEEIKKFIPVEYWNIEVKLTKTDKDTLPFKAMLATKNNVKFEKLSIKTKEEADKILIDLKEAKYIVKSVETKQRRRSPYAPYTTSTLQQDASKHLGFSPSRTMAVAQKLYEGIHIGRTAEIGLITYMRTDSLNIAKSAQTETLKFIESSYGKKFIPKTARIYKTKAKNAQEAHEAIRPTFPKISPLEIKQHLTPEEFKVYDLIWKRFTASQMTDAVYSIIIAEISAKDYIFRSSGSSLIFDGFMKVYNVDDKKETKLPPIVEQEILNLLQIIPQQHFTEPLPRYNEASLIKALEEHEIGRPSTYAPIIKTILDRLYVRLDNKKFIPTNLGIVVNNVLKNHFGNIINVEFTANAEKKLDDIAENKTKWQNVLKDFYTPFNKNIEKAEKNLQKQKIQPQISSEICPNCGKLMIIRDSRSGQFLGCSGYPECKSTMSLDKNGKKIDGPHETDMRCDKCANALLKKIGFRGKQYLICKNEKCKATYNIDKNGNKIIKLAPEHTGIKCTKCGFEMLKRIGKRGSFLTCSAFPKCRNLQWIPKTPKKETAMKSKKMLKKKI